MIDRDHHVRLADFGLSTFVADLTNPTTTILGHGSIRWKSPELHDPGRFDFQDRRPTKESDCYALGMVVLEVISGQIPFVGDKDVVVAHKIPEGETPERPEEAWFTDEVWGMLVRCWALNPRDRPNLESVVQCLEEVLPSWMTLSRLVSSTTNTSKKEPRGQDRTLTMDVSQVTSLSRKMSSQSAQEPIAHDSGSGLDNIRAWPFEHPSSRWRKKSNFYTPSDSSSNTYTATDNNVQTPVWLDKIPTLVYHELSDLARGKFDVEHLDKVPSFHQSQSQSHRTYRSPWMLYPPPVLISNGLYENSREPVPFGIFYRHHMYFLPMPSTSANVPLHPVVSLMCTRGHMVAYGFASRN